MVILGAVVFSRRRRILNLIAYFAILVLARLVPKTRGRTLEMQDAGDAECGIL
jgi:hypothetical protein